MRGERLQRLILFCLLLHELQELLKLFLFTLLKHARHTYIPKFSKRCNLSKIKATNVINTLKGLNYLV